MPPTSISIASAGGGTNGVELLPLSGSDIIVTGKREGTGDDVADGAAAAGYRLRQLKTWSAFTSYCRATVDTEAPGANDAATISRFNASGQRLYARAAPFVPIIRFVDTSTPRPPTSIGAKTQGARPSKQGGPHRRETMQCP